MMSPKDTSLIEEEEQMWVEQNEVESDEREV